jgi:hypothetical protein
MDLFILYRVMLLIAGLCLVAFLFAVWAHRHNRKVQGPGFLAYILQTVMWLGIVGMALDLGWLGGYWLAEAGRPIHITSPVNDQVVNLRQQLQGTYTAIPSGRTLWVFVAPFRTSTYFPQPNPAIIQPDGNWSSLTFVGSAGDAGQVFDIFLVLVDQQGQQVINKYLAAHTPNGLSGLPPGSVIVDKVSVWRK